MGRAYQNRKESMAKTAAAKTKVYSRYGREIYMCAKNGGVDPSANLSLRGLIDKAKKDQVPSHVIEKAIDKAKGGAGEDFQPALYEGIGPGGCMVLISALTDNGNRTFGDIRGIFSKCKAKLGSQGSVSHMFDHRAMFVFAGDDEEAALEALMMADVDVSDIDCEDGMITVLVPPTDYFKAKTALTEMNPEIDFEVEEITYLPQTEHPVSGDDIAQFERFAGLLNDLEDVAHIYHNGVFEG
ncbi:MULTISPECIES: YebC/PmpR family DNA-binding transcriptional regulator [Oceanospirillaceae]|jgi:YebC/PmpR family DNA-binding regulatory protein|uniref:Probable transcriptional regulatory protein HUF19_00210 n=1 Tax=Thalassolituus hydrocarboniclasticus TaxID=2742796 RepID=A0ABY6A5K1_9GAMM|nr:MULTISPECIES: YebC/PmpR family DNA-binding transcriptional regulator [Thalassolituus]MAY15147.1 YebC/PmpR family DNA-binding transcriptional regulator [Oceanospirillaceae bacterium]MBU2039718.1 YebC/PmpR family DNA-binding transcriptional regulator [Gammaproteobacteria bacterium]PIQ39264.1 MAG: YebC/PmpR family DNA-binding transcriptional regulator [Thalassolituus sp. CG17_big_fil_post_rev_8_21_14_2_50_53_8]MCA6059070.1 YebC/PmpR family DNA-binding transcriptional regulator [Thalassolituus s